MEHQDQNRADAYECIYAAVALIERRFDDPQLMVNVLLRVANYFDDTLDRETVAASIAANFRHQPNARDRAHQAARFLLEEEAETEVVLRGAKLLLDVAALCSESPSSPPEPAPAEAEAADEERPSQTSLHDLTGVGLHKVLVALASGLLTKPREHEEVVSGLLLVGCQVDDTRELLEKLPGSWCDSNALRAAIEYVMKERDSFFYDFEGLALLVEALRACEAHEIAQREAREASKEVAHV